MRIFPLLFLAIFSAGASFVHGAPEAPVQQPLSFERTITKSIGYEYLLSLPAGYTAQDDREWPLMLFLHGAGERGADIWLVAKHGPPKLIEQTAAPADINNAPESDSGEATKVLSESFIIVSPQCPTGERWDDAVVMALLDEIIATHRVDRERVYLTGLSMGGFGTWSIGIKFPHRFAAIVPICGGGQWIDVLLASRENREALQGLSVWAFHGAMDPVVPLDESERMVALLKRAGVTDVKLTVYPEAKHDSWTATYANPELYTWLLAHRRAPAALAK